MAPSRGSLWSGRLAERYRLLRRCRLIKRASSPWGLMTIELKTYRINFSSFDPGRMIVSVRSGPVEMQPTSTPVSSSKNLR